MTILDDSGSPYGGLAYSLGRSRLNPYDRRRAFD